MASKNILANLMLYIVLATGTQFAAPEGHHIQAVLTQMVSKVFPDCDTYLVSGGGWKNYPKLTIIDPQSIFPPHDAVHSNGIFLIDIAKAQEIDISAETTNHRHALQCAFVIIDLQFLPEDSESLSDELIRLLTPTYGAVTRKDQDHYVLVTTQTLLGTMLNLEFTRQLKFKLVLYEDGDKLGSNMAAMSVCFYCDAGQPKLLNALPAIKTLFTAISKGQNYSPKTYQKLLFEDYTINAYGHELQVSAQVRLVFVYAIEKRGDRWYFKRGFGKDIVDGITASYNYTYRVHPAMGNGGSGAILANGTWVGSVRDIIDGSCDIGVAVALNYARYKLIGGNSFFYAWVNFIMGKPKHIYTWQTVLWPFDVVLWICTLIALMLTLATLHFLPAKEIPIRHPREAFRRHFKLFILSSLFEQDFEYPSASPSRVLCGIWLFATVILTTAYRSKLVTQMTFPTKQTLPKTFAELAQSDFQWGLESAAIGGAAHQHFRTSSNPVNMQINGRMSLERNSQRCFTQGILKNFACITWSTQGEYILHRNFTDRSWRNPLTMSEDLSAIVGSGIAYKKRALFKANFDRLVDSIREMGMADRWKLMDYDRERQDHLKWVKEHPEAELHVADEEDDVLTLKNLKGPFYILFTFSFGSFLCFVIEVISGYRNVICGRSNELLI